MKRWDTFAALCGHLRAGLLGGAPPDPVADIHWELLIEASSHHFVTPALAWCLRGQIGIPSEVRDYFDATLTLNDRRNKHLLEALARTVAALNAIDIEPLLLKGAARLVDGVYPAAKLRLLGDIDVLIPGDRSADAASALKHIGFGEGAENELEAGHHHLPMLRERDTGAGVELHTELTKPPHQTIISAAWFSQNTRSFKLQDLWVRLPDPTRSVAHNIVHDQLNNGNYQLGRVQLRQLLDLAMLRARHENTIDWAELDHRFCSVGKGAVLATYLEFAEVLLGQPAPDLSHTARPRALADFRRRIDLPALRALADLRMQVDDVLARRDHPVGVLKKLISPRTWSTGIQLVKAAISRW
ncbi:MAG: nucleotidyltransferase family protein [Bradyrhizobium sp.]|uniref:nucleotidyltransferase family protein n=1 Tax=Bradyrhizobium sp. TaxID=376 RepID=UPI00272EEFC7|nr:nucleotidyltransferase family protein [Bradyrhizobium sp.]MDP1866510.1 nucleotidyltransferase family protein [Bradyrhizobium sp.]